MRAALTLGLLIAAAFAQPTIAGEPPRLGADELVAALRDSGRAGPAIVDDDIDLSRLAPPPGVGSQVIVLQDVAFRGSLHGAPSVRMRIEGGSICELKPEGAAFARPIELRGVAIGAARFQGAKLGAAWTCLECRFCRADFEQTSFDDRATFTGSVFGAPRAEGLCRRPVSPSCGEAEFAEAAFAGPARFDRASFQSPASFAGAEFRDIARFARSTAERGIIFIGARFRREAEFRDCSFADADFGPNADAAVPTSDEATEFFARTDFRRCRFTGVTRFNDTVFSGDAVFSGARFSGPAVSFLGVLALRSLDLRGVSIADGVALKLDPAAVDAIRLDWDALRPAVLRGLPNEERAATLEALSRRLNDGGESRAALAVGFDAKRARRQQETLCGGDSVGGCAAGEAEWWLWTWPTRNGSDLTLPLAALALLWLAMVAAGLPRGRVLVPPARREDAEPIYDTLPAAEFPEGTCCAFGPRRVGEAFSFATGLVFKLGSRRQRLAGPASRRLRLTADLALRAVWLLGWVMIALAAGVIAASFPGLKALAP